jgi:hypothetical protein
MRNKIFWTTTVLLAILMAWSGYSEIYNPAGIQMIVDLGYPAYFSTMLGVAKILGAVAILAQKKFPRVAEWAYAGFTFDLLGASISWMAVGVTGFAAIFPLLWFILLIPSYKLRPGCGCGCSHCGSGTCAA